MYVPTDDKVNIRQFGSRLLVHRESESSS